MKNNLNLYYDKEGDFLELSIGKQSEGSFKNLGDGIFKRIDKKTNKIIGVAIMGFKKRTEQTKDLKISLPVNIQITA